MTTSATVPPSRKRAPAAAVQPAPSAGHDAALLRLLVWLPVVAALLLVRYQDALRSWASTPHGAVVARAAALLTYGLHPGRLRWLLLAVAVACGVLLVETLWALCTVVASRKLLPHPTRRVYLRVRTPIPNTPTTVDTGRALLQRLHAVLPPMDAGPWLSLILSALPDAPVELGVSIVGGTLAQRTTWIAAIRTAVKGIDADAYVDQVPDPLDAVLAAEGRPRRRQLETCEYRLRSALGTAPPLELPARDRIDTMGTLIAALPPQRALDATAAAALQREGFQVARPAAAPDAVRYRECHLTLRPRYPYGTLEDTYRATIRTVVVSEAKRPRRSARRALHELTTALHTYTLLEPGQAHPTPLVPISRVERALRVIAGVVFLTVVGWTLLVPVVSAGLLLLPDPFIGVLQPIDHVRPWLIGLQHPSPPALLALGLVTLTVVVLLRLRSWQAPPARRLLLRAPRTPVPRVLTPWAWWRAPLTLHATQLGQLYHLPTAPLGHGVRWLLHRIIHPAPLAYIPLDELWSGRWLPFGYGVRPDGSEGLVGMLMRSAREGLAVAAPPGTGKTRFALRVFAFVRRVGLGIFGMDGKGDDQKGFVGKARRMVRPHDEANLVLLDPTDAWTISLNPLLGIDLADELGVDEALGQIERIFASVDPYTWTKSTRMPGVLRKVMQLVLVGEPIPTIAHGKQVLDDPIYRARLLPQCREHNSEVAAFWDAIERGDDTIPEATLSGLRSRFDALLDTRIMRRLFSLPVRSFSFEEAIANRFIVLNPIPEQRLGGRAGPVGMLIFQLFLRAAFHRPGSDETRENFVVALDEFDFLIRNGDPQDIATALTKVRSFGIVLILLHQFLIQLGAFKDFVLSIPNRIIMRVDNPDAQEYAKLYPHSGLTASDIANQDNHHYVKHMHGPTPIGPHSVRPLEWLPEEEVRVPDHAGDWQSVLPIDSPTPAFDAQLAALIHSTPRVERAAIVVRLAAADEARWQRVWERWQAIAAAQRAYILDHPGCIPLPTAAELQQRPELVDAVVAALDDPTAIKTLQRDQQRMTRQLWLSRLWFGVPPLLADVMYARMRTAIAPSDSATDRLTPNRSRMHDRRDGRERTAGKWVDRADASEPAWAGSDRDRAPIGRGMPAALFAADDDED